jgi:hypothetical protein
VTSSSLTLPVIGDEVVIFEPGTHTEGEFRWTPHEQLHHPDCPSCSSSNESTLPQRITGCLGGS